MHRTVYMPTRLGLLGAALGFTALLCAGPALAADAAQEQRGLNELRNTVVNLLQGLVEQGVISRDKAEQMVRDAQGKAATEAAATAARDKEEEGAIRVPYVPQIVKDELRRQVAEDLGAQVTQNVLEQAKSESWAMPGALPDWIRRMRWSGDVRVRGEGDLFADDNAANSYLNFQTVNEQGGIGKAGIAALANVSEDHKRMRMRLRVGFDTNLGYGWSLGGRLTTGSLRNPVSTNQTLGTSAFRYQTGFDLGYLEWTGNSDTGKHTFTATGGRIRNPWLSTNLVWDEDLTFEGVAANYRLGLLRDDPYSHYAFATVAAMPLQEFELTADKWLFGGQLGMDWKFSGGSRLRVGTAYYLFRNITGERNAFGSSLLDYTAPQFVQRGNTLFDIRNDADPATNLFALAAEYRLANLTANFDWRVAPGYRLTLSGDYVKNVGYRQEDVLATTGLQLDARDTGYQAEVGFGSAATAVAHAWRGYFGYRYLERDAVLDALTDSDFRLGGTDVKGYYLGADYSLSPRVAARLRYLSGSEIDGPPFAVEVVQLDLTASF